VRGRPNLEGSNDIVGNITDKKLGHVAMIAFAIKRCNAC
jgi:hypothetical protein